MTTFLELKKEVGYLVGYSRDSTNWTTEELNDIEASVHAGVRQFYDPPPLEQSGASHSWSFLKPWDEMVLWSTEGIDDTITVSGVYDSENDVTDLTATSGSFYPSMVGRDIEITDIGTFEITSYTDDEHVVVSGDATCTGKTFSIESTGYFRLPASYGGMVGDHLYFDDQTYREPIVHRGQATVRRQWTSGIENGTPRIFGVAPIKGGNRFDLMVYPIPGSSYSIHYRYAVLTSDLSADADKPYGTAFHGETIMESCLAIAEERIMDGGMGIHQKKFMLRLQAAIAKDKKDTGPTYFGYNGDDSTGSRISRHNSDNIEVFVNGKHPSEY